MRLLRIQLTSCDQRSYLLPLALRHNPRRRAPPLAAIATTTEHKRASFDRRSFWKLS
ncbi:hypothetical protein CMEL01_05721 [Colletotrichum melonis]|uniref:Uncharacterized protein n=2 Tax=Colletotrichum acutatum species complex TaxID=2707335 RepID=A0AAI9ZAF2_9PEZI|nr:uncharacterized protein CCOS01_01041 [Colletotrichum costaricense]KAI3533589.1 hypothetical protein CSPX01_12662 [Colletotrichum filicis]KAK1454062.1 hypothetical protein CMEL01_05721 [Colletotrichum melonis]KAK1539727.1 hypothetical protein CCOS01_01041 [Colletotrichum costaricense]